MLPLDLTAFCHGEPISHLRSDVRDGGAERRRAGGGHASELSRRIEGVPLSHPVALRRLDVHAILVRSSYAAVVYAILVPPVEKVRVVDVSTYLSVVVCY